MSTGTRPPELDRYGCIALLLTIGSMIAVCWLATNLIAYLLGGT